MEVGCPGTWGTGTAAYNTATSPAHQKNPAPALAPVTLNLKNSGKPTE